MTLSYQRDERFFDHTQEELTMYDAKKDVTLERETVIGEGEESIEVSVCSYNDGAEKIQLTRCKTDKNGEKKYSKLGRMTISEAAAVADKIMELATKRLVGA
jgi:hypothetical protein